MGRASGNEGRSSCNAHHNAGSPELAPPLFLLYKLFAVPGKLAHHFPALLIAHEHGFTCTRQLETPITRTVAGIANRKDRAPGLVHFPIRAELEEIEING